MHHSLELLSPAKNFETGKAAIDCGADAVYIGATKFGARVAVGNSIGEIEKLIKYAHQYYARVYVTLNTLLYDIELIEAQKLIHQIWNVGADALIIQDMGILEMDLPPIPIFASTQTNNTTWQKVQFLEKVGIQRVILARELSIKEISEIKQHTNIELESFIHGAICVCYSGQCYLSQAITSRSGNRGECSQPCRWDYTLKNSSGKIIIQKKHLLSLKDLNYSNHLESLIDAGITSFKIEGRLKDIAYVKNITGWYRKQLDTIIEKRNGCYKKPSSGKTIFNFIPDPERTFNRGYTDYFISGKRQKMASFATQKSLGKQIGRVVELLKNKIKIEPDEQFNNGDGICFIDNNKVLQGFRVNKVDGNFIFPHEMPKLKVGTILFRNHDQQFESHLEKQKTERKIDIRFTLSETNTGLILIAYDDDNNIAKAETELEKQPAVNKDSAISSIQQALSKTGNSIFSVIEIDIKIKQPLFIKQSIINDLRRKCLDQLELEREKKFLIKSYTIEKNDFPYTDKNLDYRGNVLNKKALEFYNRHGAKISEAGFESLIDTNNKILMTTRYCLKYESGQCSKYQGKREIKDKFLLLENEKTSLQLEFDCVNCQMLISKID
jgi:23S rRNA 5-hydroxycytidine C2501 synthase